MVLASYSLLGYFSYRGTRTLLEIIPTSALGYHSMQQLFLAALTVCTLNATDFCDVKYLSNHDGDTITVEIPDVHPLLGHRMPIRIKGIDTPEMISKKACEKVMAGKAKEYVSKRLTVATKIDIVECEREKYSRLLCRVVVDGADLGDELLANKLAVIYDGGTKKDFKCSK